MAWGGAWYLKSWAWAMAAVLSMKVAESKSFFIRDKREEIDEAAQHAKPACLQGSNDAATGLRLHATLLL
ncbi:hypothetical protein GCM10022409_16550 [Hymenobacter glaciei]|uniref:Secreted protein n=1 Tax=Hymenobacter glaciei TaxID=877209 RepID=A0ABP7U013_9BACT